MPNNSIFSSVKNLISTYTESIGSIAYLASLEATLARKSLGTILILLFISVLLILSTWCTLIFTLFIGLIYLHFTLWSATLLVLFFNIALLVCVLFSIVRLKRNLFFPATRRQITSYLSGSIK